MTAIGIAISILTGSRSATAGAPLIPSNVSLPAITGEARVGVQLICSQGTWTGSPSPTFAYQWKSGVTNVGINSNTFTPTASEVAKVMTCDVTATNSSGSATATAPGTLPVEAAGALPVNTLAPAVTGNAIVGSVLTTTDGTWTGTPTPTYTYQWQGNAVNIGGATAKTYTLLAGQLGQTVRCVVTATNTSGAVPANSNSTVAITNPVAAPVNTVLPAVTGTTVVGSLLSCTSGTWTGNPTPTYTYQWRAGAAPIGGATAATFTLTSAELGYVMDCVVTATNTGGSVPATSNQTAIVTAAPVIPANSVPPALSGLERVGETLTCSSGTWSGTPTPTFTYQWQASAANINGATSPTYVLAVAQQGLIVRCVVTATNSQGAVPANSNDTAPIAAENTQTIAQRLLGSEPNGLAIGFTDNSILIRDTVTPANNYDGQATAKLTFSRASTAYRTDNLGVLVLAPVDAPRLNYHPITHEALGLLVENAATNEFLQSNAFNNATAWQQDGLVLAAASGVAPDGSNTAWLATFGTSNFRIYQFDNTGVVGDKTISIYAKAGTVSILKTEDAGIPGGNAEFNLLAGTVVINGALVAFMTPAGNGWWKCSITDGHHVAAGNANWTSFSLLSAGNLLIWGAQLEVGTNASSYIPTAAAAATRALDQCKLLISAFNFSQTQGMMMTRPSPYLPANGNLRVEACINDDSTSNQIWNAISGTLSLLVEDNNTAQAQFSPVGPIQSKIGQTWQLNDCAGTANGDAPTVDSAGIIPGALTHITFGNRSTGAPYALDGSLTTFLHLPRRVSNAELQTLTTPFSESTPPLNTVAPIISGTPTVGQTLTCANGTWTGEPSPSFTYQWYDDAATIVGALASTYLLTANEFGGMITCRVTGTNTGGNDVGTSNALGPVAANASFNTDHFWTLAAANIAGATVNDLGTSPANGTIAGTLYPDDSQGGLDVGRKSITSGYITLPSSCLPASLDSPFSWFAFVRIADLAAVSSNGSTRQTLYSDFKDATNGIRIMMMGTGLLKVSLFKASGNVHWQTTVQAWANNNYEAHVGFTWNGTAFQFYVDGLPVASVGGVSESKPDGNYIMARSATLGQISGTMAKIRIAYNALTANDVLNLYDADFVNTRPLGNPAGAGKMRFQDNFQGSVLDTGKWQPNWLAGNLTDITKPINGFETAACDPAQTTLAASEITFTAITKAVVDNQGTPYNLVTGIVNSGGPAATTAPKFQYTLGYAEARVYMPSTGVNVGVALDNWPAWWTNALNHTVYGGWPGGVENDLTEGLGVNGQPTLSSSRMHYHAPTPAGAAGGGADWNQSYAYGGNGALGNAYHVYGCLTEVGSVKYYLDGVLVSTLTDQRVLALPQFLVLNLGMSDGYPGGPQIVPGMFKADWVRYYDPA